MAAKERAWASGRVLTATQRERKREIDRQRSSRLREQTTSHIQALESKVRALEGISEFGAGILDAGSVLAHGRSHDQTDVLLSPVSTATYSIGNSPDLVGSFAAPDCQSIFNEALRLAFEIPASQVCIDPRRNQDAIVRGVVHGWNEVVAQHPDFCPLWTVIRFLDSRIFRLSGTLTRFCTLTMIHNMLLCFVKAADVHTLPYWYRPRPTQKSIAHPLAVDILPWPGLRERAVLNPDLTSSNKFWNDVIYCFRFSWPYSEADAVKVDPASKLLAFTDEFQNSVREIHKWTMDENFFAAFPETVDDIKPAPYLEYPLSNHWPAIGDMTFYYLLPLPAEDEDCSYSKACGMGAGSPVQMGRLII